MSDFNLELDTSGLNCPLPVFKARKALSGMSAGECLHLIATDIRAKQDIPAFCKMTVDLFDFKDEDFIQNISRGGAATFLEFASEADITLYI